MDQECEKLKDKGNSLFKQQNYQEAIQYYDQAIELMEQCIQTQPNNTQNNQRIAIYYSNKAAVHLKMENYGLAINDADQAINYYPQYPKSYYRKADGLISIDKYQEAKQSLNKLIVDLKVQDKQAQQKYEFVTKVIQQKQFLEAISDQQQIAKVKPDQLTVDEQYLGPRLEQDQLARNGITSEWVQSLMQYQAQQKKLHKKYLWNLLLYVKEILKQKSTLVYWSIDDDVELTVCGDIHGQYYDLLNIFNNLNGMPAENNPYLFNGDFVDRGSFSVEVIVTLFAWMAHNPNCMHLTRGNHEAKNMNKLYGFEGEVLYKYCEQTYELFCELFNLLPLTYILNRKVMVCHGGLFQEEGVTLADISRIDRIREPPDQGIMCDLLWADPVDIYGRHPSKRGISQAFGPDVTANFLKQNGLELLVRSHEMKPKGYQIQHNGKCITIFSAPNYCDQMRNKGAYIKFKGSSMQPQFKQFRWVEHPAIPPMAYTKQT